MRGSDSGAKVVDEHPIDPEGGDLDEVVTNFVDYKTDFDKGHPHPDQLVESASLASTKLPPLVYKHNLPPIVAQSGMLSLPQLEAVFHACQAHEVKLTSGERAGFFLGDGAGVGKGR